MKVSSPLICHCDGVSVDLVSELFPESETHCGSREELTVARQCQPCAFGTNPNGEQGLNTATYRSR